MKSIDKSKKSNIKCEYCAYFENPHNNNYVQRWNGISYGRAGRGQRKKRQVGGELVTQPTSKTCYQVFDDLFPYYLSIGMSADEFWNGDCELVKAYRKAEELRKKRVNFELWLAERYAYEKDLRVAPAYFGKKPHDYTEEPFPLTLKEAKEKKQREEQQKYEQYINTMVATAVDNRKQIKEV